MKVLNPVGMPGQICQQGSFTQRPVSLDGKVLGLLSNVKPNSDVMLKRIGELLESRLNVASTIFLEKQSPSYGATSEALDNLIRECDVVIAGVGD
jgi:hypothetical protein